MLGSQFELYDVSSFESWTHLAVLFHGIEDDEGLTVVYNGGEATQGSTTSGTKPTDLENAKASGRLIIGTRKPDSTSAFEYSTVMVDELIMWDKKLTETQIKQLYDSYGYEEDDDDGE